MPASRLLRPLAAAVLLSCLSLPAAKADVFTLEQQGLQFWKPLSWTVEATERDGNPEWTIFSPDKRVNFQAWLVPGEDIEAFVQAALPRLKATYPDARPGRPGDLPFGDGDGYGLVTRIGKPDGQELRIILAGRAINDQYGAVVLGEAVGEAADEWETSIGYFLDGWTEREMLPAEGPVEIRCESADKKVERCSVGFMIEKASLEDQLSKKDCVEGKNWNLAGYALQVSGGCRGIFRLEGSAE